MWKPKQLVLASSMQFTTHSSKLCNGSGQTLLALPCLKWELQYELQEQPRSLERKMESSKLKGWPRPSIWCVECAWQLAFDAVYQTRVSRVVASTNEASAEPFSSSLVVISFCLVSIDTCDTR